MLNAALTRITYFGEKARVYDAKNTETDKRRREEIALREFMKDASGTVLDIPVGTGHFFHIYRVLDLNVIGMDVSNEMMDQARMKAPEVDIRYGDIMQIPLSDSEVDIAVCIRLLSLIDTDEMILALKELARVASQFIIFSLKVGIKKVIKNRSITHPTAIFTDALCDAKLQIENAAMVREPDFLIYKAVKCS